jgi:hypothetical protein
MLSEAHTLWNVGMKSQKVLGVPDPQVESYSTQRIFEGQVWQRFRDFKTGLQISYKLFLICTSA